MVQSERVRAPASHAQYEIRIVTGSSYLLRKVRSRRYRCDTYVVFRSRASLHCLQQDVQQYYRTSAPFLYAMLLNSSGSRDASATRERFRESTTILPRRGAVFTIRSGPSRLWFQLVLEIDLLFTSGLPPRCPTSGLPSVVPRIYLVIFLDGNTLRPSDTSPYSSSVTKSYLCM